MKINKTLLKRYFDGTCSENEKIEVEAWLASEVHDDPLVLDEITKDHYKSLIWQNLSADVGFDDSIQEIPLYKRLSKYAAVTFLFLTVFVAGRMSVQSGYANPLAAEESKKLLYINGENGAYAQIEGNKYALQFDGVLKLYNGSNTTKIITCGINAFELQPFQTYFLTGSHEQPRLLSGQVDEELESMLQGDFSIRVISDGSK
jgi:hypothetical protein